MRLRHARFGNPTMRKIAIALALAVLMSGAAAARLQPGTVVQSTSTRICSMANPCGASGHCCFAATQGWCCGNGQTCGSDAGECWP